MTTSLPRMFLHGTFRLEDPGGKRVPVTSNKGQAMLALLALSRGGERSRSWLQAHLWSDRAQQQASQSLRTELMSLVRTLTVHGIHLNRSRSHIALDLKTVEIVNHGDGEFLEGIDVKDEAFEDWLIAERQRREDGKTIGIEAPHILTTARRAWEIALISRSTENFADRWLEDSFNHSLARSLREIFSAPVSIGVPERIFDGLIVTEVQSLRIGPEKLLLRVSVSHPAERRQVCSHHAEVPDAGPRSLDHPELLRAIAGLIEALEDYVVSTGIATRHVDDPDALLGLALRSMFTMEQGSIQEADDYFGRAFDMRPRGLLLAWRAQLRAIQLIEMHDIDREAATEEGKDLVRRAMHLEPNNSMVLATLANSLRRLDRDDERSLYLAERSVLLNPSNPMAQWAMSAAKVYSGKVNAAYEHALVGQRLARLSPHRFWWDTQLYTAALLSGHLDDALKFAQSAHAGNPEFKPPLRYLIALHARLGNLEDAVRYAAKLKKIEPNFSVDRLLKDDDYPASLIRRIPGIKTTPIYDLT